MGDMGDYWREEREWKRDLRMSWHECPTCAVSFGTGTSVPPGRRCHHCGWEAPGEIGSDVKEAKARQAAKLKKDRKHKKKRQNSIKARTCQICGKVLKSEQGRAHHIRNVHRKGI